MRYKIKPEGHMNGLVSMHFDDLPLAVAAAWEHSMCSLHVDVVERGTNRVLLRISNMEVVAYPKA